MQLDPFLLEFQRQLVAAFCNADYFERIHDWSLG
jgi:hypothetical protein